MHPVCSFRANEVHISSAMPHSMPNAVKCELYTMQRMELRRTLGSLFTSGGGNCRSGLIELMCFKVNFSSIASISIFLLLQLITSFDSSKCDNMFKWSF